MTGQEQVQADNRHAHGFATRAIHAGQAPDEASGAVVVPVTLSSTFAQDAVGVHRGYEYSRSGNPTRAALETCLADLEGAKYGFAFASGLAAGDAVLRLLAPGQKVLLGNDAYGGTYRSIAKVHGPAGLLHTTADLCDLAAVEAAMVGVDMVWLETPTNPLLRVIDIAAVAGIARRHNTLVVVDNTFATPYLQTPIDLGADIVVHSTTKYLGGHSDVVGGFVATSDATLAERIGYLQNAIGAVPAPFDCYLVLRGIKTLEVRMDRHAENAARIVEFLCGRGEVAEVMYPFLDRHPGSAVAKKQMRNGGGMVSFTVAGGAGMAKQLAESTALFTLAESLGAVESLIEHPFSMTHASVVGSPLEVPANLIRLSVGIEHVDDLIADLEQAFTQLRY